MKRIVQFTLICSVILALFIFKNKYFSENNKSSSKQVLVKPNNQLEEVNENSLIKNLKYEINIDQKKIILLLQN